MKGTAVLRVAAYCRVSTDSDDQLHSLFSQKQYFEEYIAQHPRWVLVHIFADEGITGTSTRRRTQFNAMIAAAERGDIDLIVTKEVSRFARNTMDTLAHTRRLHELGVGVFFISDNIDTRENDGEFRLTIMASVAQEESRKTSERVKWGQRRSMERGVVFGNDSLYGYQTQNGKLLIRQQEAAIIRLIYFKCIQENKGAHVIAKELEAAGISTPRGGADWSSATVRRILTNEKYCGDLLQKKQITPNFLTHKKIRNPDPDDTVYLRDHHQPIIDREDFVQAQQAIARRRPQGGTRSSVRYWCSGRVRCAACNGAYLPRRTTRKNGDAYILWCCRTRRQGGACSSPSINDATLSFCAHYALGHLKWNKEELLRTLSAELASTTASSCAAPCTSAGVRHNLNRAFSQFLDGEITAQELTTLRDTSRLDLAPISTAVDAPDSADLWYDLLQRTMPQASEVLAQTISHIFVHDGALDIEFAGLNLCAHLTYRTSGKGRSYQTDVMSCQYTDETKGARL